MKYSLLILLFFSGFLYADARQIDDFHWEGVERIVAIGDLHGDYGNYIKTLQAAGLVDKKGKWAAGKTHLVQTGDIPDRGPDTLKIIDHISKLAKQAKRKGGRIHSLIGNHEAMNMYGDLRYTHPGEDEEFVSKNSAALRDRYFDIIMQNLQQQDPDRFATLPENYREEWNKKYPLGWVEHRQAWDPAWNPEGKYAQWVLDKPVAIQVNDTIFLHGGLSAYYCQNTLSSITEKAHASLRNFDPSSAGILEDENGPLWYRGLSDVEPHAPVETVDAILEQHGAKHIVVGHTVTSGVIWPRYDAKVVMIDTGIGSAYGGYVAYLEIGPDGLQAGYPNGKLPLPSDSEGLVPYLQKVIEGDPENAYLRKRLQDLLNPPVEETGTEAPAGAENGEAADGATASPEQPAAEPVPICGIS
jgi:hypothetical protein